MRCLLGIILWLWSVPVLAQEFLLADHHFYHQKRQTIKFSQLSLGLLTADSTTAYGMAELRYFRSSGSFRKAQDAYQTQVSGLYTEGFNQLGRFKVQGQFEFSRTIEDSLANNLKGLKEDIHPYYYFVQKPGEFERQDYRFKALLSYDLIEGKLSVGSGIDYLSHTSSRSVDPRPRITQFNLKVSPEISYKHNGHQMSVGILWGYGDEDYRIVYKNRNYGLSLTFPDRIFYINQGYGFIVMKDTANMRRYNSHSGLNVSYSNKINHYAVGVHLAHTTQDEENTHDVKYRKNYHIRSTFTLKRYETQLLLSEDQQKRRQQIFIAAQLAEGSDFNRAFQARNYSAYIRSLSFGYYYQKKRAQGWQPEVGIKADYLASKKQDFATEHLLEQGYLEGGPTFTVYNQSRGKESFSFSFAPFYRLPLHYNYTAPSSQETIFTRDILFHDYSYYSSRVFGVNVEALVLSARLFRNFAAGLSINSSYMKQLGSEQVLEVVGEKPNDNQLINWIKLNLYL